MLVPRPEGHDERVAFLPMKFLAVDHRRACAAEGVIDARAGVAVRLGLLAGPEHLNPTGHGRQGWPAGGRVDEFERGAVVGIAGRFGQPLQRWIGVAPVIMQQGRRGCRAADGSGGTVESRGVDGFSDRQAAFIGIERNLIQCLYEGHIQPVDPHHVLVALVRMLVPAAVRRENEIAVFHHHFLAVDVGVSAVALENESERAHGVTVRRRDFAGLDKLER